ncbi:hypothetical protein QJS04_geneDACA004887 [Acorus gramineus]|uniref:Uncharacterized protein n=1 Tax=Acorus gramineus TaxID=55184 RepID=A0AAV9BZ54_ACOGR|nr:hypothetical protein QJS04_geneDACA004887 [Acorus gramineus]
MMLFNDSQSFLPQVSARHDPIPDRVVSPRGTTRSFHVRADPLHSPSLGYRASQPTPTFVCVNPQLF